MKDYGKTRSLTGGGVDIYVTKEKEQMVKPDQGIRCIFRIFPRRDCQNGRWEHLVPSLELPTMTPSVQGWDDRAQMSGDAEPLPGAFPMDGRHQVMIYSSWCSGVVT